MRGVFMEKTAQKTRIPFYLIIVALVIIAAAAVGIYFLTGGAREKEPSRGTYVMAQVEEFSL